MPLSKKDLHRFCQYVNEIQKERSIPHFILSIIHPKENIILTGGKDIDEKTLFPIGSLSKGFACVAIAILVDKKLLHWEDSIYKYINIALPNQIDLTIYQLITHINPFYEHALTEVSEFGFTHQELISKLRFMPLTNEYKFSYQNILFSLVGDIVSQVSGLSYADFLRENIFKPLQMIATTALEKDYLQNKNRASANIRYKNVISKISYSPFWHVMGAPSCIASSATDLTQWLKFHLHIAYQSLLSDAVFNAIHYPLPNAKPPYAMGWWQADEKGLVLSHTGSVTGFESAIAILPRSKIGIAISSNLSGDSFTYDMLNEFIRRVTQENIFACTNVLKLQKPLSRPQYHLQFYTGHFYHRILENFQIKLKKNTLILEIKKNHTSAILSPISILATHPKITPALKTLAAYECFQLQWCDQMAPAGKIYYDEDRIAFAKDMNGKIQTILIYIQSISEEILICEKQFTALSQINSLFIKRETSQSFCADEKKMTTITACLK